MFNIYEIINKINTDMNVDGVITDDPKKIMDYIKYKI